MRLSHIPIVRDFPHTGQNKGIMEAHSKNPVIGLPRDKPCKATRMPRSIERRDARGIRHLATECLFVPLSKGIAADKHLQKLHEFYESSELS